MSSYKASELIIQSVKSVEQGEPINRSFAKSLLSYAIEEDLVSNGLLSCKNMASVDVSSEAWKLEICVETFVVAQIGDVEYY